MDSFQRLIKLPKSSCAASRCDNSAARMEGGSLLALTSTTLVGSEFYLYLIWSRFIGAYQVLLRIRWHKYDLYLWRSRPGCKKADPPGKRVVER